MSNLKASEDTEELLDSHNNRKFRNVSNYCRRWWLPIIAFISFIIIYLNYPHKPCPRKNCKAYNFQARESALAHSLLDGLSGIEIGGAIHNPFCLNTINVDFTNDTTIFKESERKISGGDYLPVDVVASGDKLPFFNETFDFVISSHVIEHFYDPIKAIEEWLRVIKPNGYVFMIIPHKERTFDKHKNRTTIEDLIKRHQTKNLKADDHGHHTIWITEDAIELCQYMGWNVVAQQDVDDKVGNGFTIVIQKS